MKRVMAMEEYLNKGIKEIISQFPRIADILNEYNIGCVPCNIGTCLLKDIVEIHNLAIKQEEELLSKIAKVIYPAQVVKIPKIQRKPPVAADQLSYSPPLKKLVDEHVLIKRWIALIPEVIQNLDLESKEIIQIILDGIDFIRSYADKFHHAKEEDILFKYFDENLDIIKTMLSDHETARSHVKAILEALQKQDKVAVISHLNGYRELLMEHIKKEDEILYPWIDRNLSITQIGELFTKFNETEEKLDKEVIENCKKFAQEIEQKIHKLKTKKEVIK